MNDVKILNNPDALRCEHIGHQVGHNCYIAGQWQSDLQWALKKPKFVRSLLCSLVPQNPLAFSKSDRDPGSLLWRKVVLAGKLGR